MDVPSDRYGPLNRFAGPRNNYYNPGGIYSNYDINGNLIPDDEEPTARQSKRIQGLSAPNISLNECYGKTCPITQSKITGYGIKLSDGHCYNANSIKEWYNNNPNGKTMSPFRKPYTDEDIEKITSLNQSLRGGRKTRRKSKRAGRNKRKSRRNRKSI